MAHDLMSQFYTSLSLPLQEKVIELTRIIDQSSSTKDLQTIFPQLINNIFSSSFSTGWDLKSITCDVNRYEFEALISFLEPQGPMFRLCYRLLSDTQLKYELPLNVLPLDLQVTLERGRCPQFYADMLTADAQTMNMISLALNPFDYYIFNFALYLINNNQNKNTWENWNSVYFALACDYLMHFLPLDPNMPVLPHISNYTGKVPIAAPLKTANRPLYSPSLLLISDLTGSVINNQHTSQTQSRNEVWRSETVLQVFIDIWMSVEQLNARSIEMYQRSYQINTASPERVRIVRVLIKHLHSFSAKYVSDPAVRSSALRKYARQILCVRAYHYVKHLVTTWPLDASFRLVMELWLSLIQPWRYVNNNINQDRFPSNNHQDENPTHTLDASFTQFIAENFPSYTCIFQLILPRFMRLDLTTYKNAVMLFRLGKVFSQPHLVPILWNLEHAILDSGSGVTHSSDLNFSNSMTDQSYTYNGVSLQKWVAIAKQAISEFNMPENFEYKPIWNDNMRSFALEFVKKIISAKTIAEKNVEEFSKKIDMSNQGFWSSLMHWLMIATQDESDGHLEEVKKVPTYLNTSIHNFAVIFGLSEALLLPSEPIADDSLENSSFVNSTAFPFSITNKLRSKSTNVHYMGNPDLMPIASYESTILVRILHQISTKINELYEPTFANLWNRQDIWGYAAREVLQKPCTIQTYVKDITNHYRVIRQDLPPRLLLRRLGSQAFIFWITVGYLIMRLFSFSGLSYILILFSLWLSYVFIKGSFKMLKVIRIN